MKIKTPRKEATTKYPFAVYGFDKIEMERMFNRICDVHTKYLNDPKIHQLEDVFIGMTNELFPGSDDGECCKMAMLLLVQFQVLSEEIHKAQKSGRKKKPLVTADEIVEALVTELQKRK